MLSAEAMRLAAIEVLTPHAALVAGAGFPTLAGHRVFDSRAAAIGDLDEASPYTPVLTLRTAESLSTARGEASDFGDADCEAVLEITAELAIVSQPDGGDPFPDAMAEGDPEARLVLAALVGQVVSILTESEAGYLFRRFVLGFRRIEYEPFAVPQLGLRWHRTTIRMSCALPQDRYDMVAGGLPEPLATLAGLLPEESYAKAKLDDLAARFAGTARTPLAGVAILDSADGDPIASI